MAFSIRTFFGKDKPAEDGEATASGNSSDADPQIQGPMNGTSGSPFQPSGNSNPFGSNMLFKTANGADAPGSPVGSPFAPAANSSQGVLPGLTVGDIMAQLPPDVAKNSQLAPSQVLHLPEDVLEKALKSGQAALPLFEIYRVCPALFLAPISPQDPRLVSLPPQKIAHLIPNGASGAKPEASKPPSGLTGSPFGQGGSPFGQQAQMPAWTQGGGSPFGQAPATPAAAPPEIASPPVSQPPSSPFGSASTAGPSPIAGASPFGSSAPTGGNSNPFAASAQQESAAPPPATPPPFNPFSTAQSGSSNSGTSTGGSPFGAASSTPPAAGASAQFPFATPPASGSPFSFTPPAAPEQSAPQDTPPFSASPPANGSEKSPFGGGFGLNPFKPADQVPPQAGGAVPPPVSALPDFFTQVTPETKSPFGLPTATPGVDPFASSPAPDVVPPPAQSQSIPSGLFSAAPVPQIPTEPVVNAALFPPATPNKLPEAPVTPPAFPPSPGGSFNPFDRIQALGGSGSSSAAAPFAAKPPENAVSVPQVASAFSVGNGNQSASEPVSFNLASVLKQCRPEDLGMASETIPPWVQVNLPAALLNGKPVSADGVQISIEELRSGLPPEYRNLLGAAKAGLLIKIPANGAPVAPSSPAATFGEASGSKAPAPPAETFDPFVSMAQWGAAPPASAASPPPAAQPVQTPPSAFNFKPAEIAPATPAPGKENEWPFGMNFGGAPTPSEKEDEPVHFDLLDVPATSEPVKSTIFPSEPTKKAEAPFFEATPAKSAAFTPAMPVEARSAVVGSDKHRRLLLRVLLGTQEDLDVQGILQKINGLPDVRAVVCLKGNTLLASTGNGSPEADHFIKQVPLIHEHLRPLAKLTGADEGETFSVRTEQNLVTFSMEPEITLGVLHAAGAHETTLREKITLLTPEIAAMVA